MKNGRRCGSSGTAGPSVTVEVFVESLSKVLTRTTGHNQQHLVTPGHRHGHDSRSGGYVHLEPRLGHKLQYENINVLMQLSGIIECGLHSDEVEK